MIIIGRCWKLGDNISTDHIISGKYKFSTISSLDQMLPHVFEEVIPNFYKQVRYGDVIVAGRNFGMGSSREHAPRLLKMIGINAILAKSFARIFFRNAINIGLPVITVNKIPNITEQWDIIEINLARGIVTNLSKGIKEKIKPYPKGILKIITEGGIISYIRKYGDLPWEENIE